MANLPQLLNTPFEIDINGVKLQVKKAGINDLAELQNFIDKVGEDSSSAHDTKILAVALELCLKKIYSDVTSEYVNELIPATFAMEKGKDILVQLGFTRPPQKEEEKIK
jgi:hypothetical protein